MADKDTDLGRPYKARITPEGQPAYEATIEYYHPDISPPGPQPEPPPPVIVIPPVPTPIPTDIPEQPEVFGGAHTILTLSQDGWKWLVIPAKYEPPRSDMPAPKDKGRR